MQTTIAVACNAMNMTPAEAIAASTINGAHAMGRAGSIGSIEAGKSADLTILGVPDYRELPYHFGVNLVNLVMIRGAVLVERSEGEVAGPLIAPPIAPLIECVANFSEGRNAATVRAIEDAIASSAGVLVLRAERDTDHNRSVITFAGPPDAVAEGALRGIAVAVECIDLRRHAGVHPSMGAADVVPFVPLEGTTLADCAAIARRTGEEVWKRLGVPVYFYEAAATSPDRRLLENVRRGGFENPKMAPDLGGPALHPSAGACIIGARKILIAFNINLQTDDVSVARDIARKIRASSGGMPFVKALGLPLAARGLAQVSMNLTDFEQTPLHEVFDAVRREAAARGVEIAGSEIIGLVPKKALEDAAAHYLQCENFESGLVLENRLENKRAAGVRIRLVLVSINPQPQRRPAWLRAPAPSGDNYHELKRLVRELNLHTVCESAACPNVGECWNQRTATFMILGNVCTRRCGFCAVQKGPPDDGGL